MPEARQASAKHQKTIPKGKAKRRSSAVGWDFRWKEIRIAMLTMAMYMLRRSQERKAFGCVLVWESIGLRSDGGTCKEY